MSDVEFQDVNLSIDQSGSELSVPETVRISLQDIHSNQTNFNSHYMTYSSSPTTATWLASPQENTSLPQINSDFTLIGELPNLSSSKSHTGTLTKESHDIEDEAEFQLTLVSPEYSTADTNSPFLRTSQDHASSRSRHISATKDVFSDQEKFAYVGLCKLFLVEQANNYPFKFPEFGSANASYTLFGKKIMRKLYLHMAIDDDEQQMIEKLPNHGVIPKDLSQTILQGCVTKAAKFATSSTIKVEGGKSSKLDSGTDTTVTVDIRWTIILDLFLLLTNEDIYDSRSRTLLQAISEELELDWFDVVKMEKEISEQFQINDVADTLIHNSEISGRKKTNLKTRLALMGVATVGGGFIIGLSAGLLAPLIASGLGAAFGGLGLAGSSAFFGSAGGAALITTGGVVTGGSNYILYA